MRENRFKKATGSQQPETIHVQWVKSQSYYKKSYTLDPAVKSVREEGRPWHQQRCAKQRQVKAIHSQVGLGTLHFHPSAAFSGP